MTNTDDNNSDSTLVSELDQMRTAANALRDDAQYKSAHQKWLSYWHLCKQNYGENSVEALEALMELAESFFDLGDDTEAADMFRDAIRRCEEFLGPNHPTTGSAYQGLANMLSYAEKCMMAEPLMRKALEIQTLNFGLEHDETARQFHDLGLLLMRADDYEAAEEALRESLRIFQVVNGVDDPSAATAMHTLGHTLFLMDKVEEAQTVLNKVVKVRELSLGSRHPDLALSLRLLGDILDDGDSPELAKPLYARALAINEEVFEPNHPQVIHSLYWYADYLERFGELDEPLRLFSRVADIKQCGPDSGGPNLETVRLKVTNLQEQISTRKYIERPLQGLNALSSTLDSPDLEWESKTLH
jgi:tetratricopeptide (TPR) repeat protein